MRSNTLARAALPAASALLVCTVAFAQSLASFAQTTATSGGSKLKPHLVTAFDPAFFAESITAGRDGNLYVSVSNWVDTCEILRVTPDGKQTKVVAAFPLDICGNGFLLGVAFDEKNRLHVAVATGVSGLTGVYRVEGDGTTTLVLSLPDTSCPNGLAFYYGDMYVSDSNLGAIWKKRPHDSPVATVPWYQNIPLLAPSGFGANGIAFYGNALYIAVYFADTESTTGSIVRLPILHDGSPGVPEIVVQPDSRLDAVDGVAFDFTGKLWFTANTSQPIGQWVGGRLGTVEQDGTLRILANNPGWLDYPTMVVFGTTFRTRDTLYLTNGGSNAGQPNVLSFQVGIPGLPLPVH